MLYKIRNRLFSYNEAPCATLSTPKFFFASRGLGICYTYAIVLIFVRRAHESVKEQFIRIYIFAMQGKLKHEQGACFSRLAADAAMEGVPMHFTTRTFTVRIRIPPFRRRLTGAPKEYGDTHSVHLAAQESE